jgi:hypothetical protein
VGTRSGECLIRCTDWAEANLRSVGPVSHRDGPQRRVHGSRHLASNRRSPLPQYFGAHCATSFAAANSPHPYSFMSRSSLRSPGTAFGALPLSTDAFGRSSLVACPAQSACSRHTIAGPKDRLAISETLRVHACSPCWTLYSAKCARARLRRAIWACTASERHHLSGSILPGVQPRWPAASARRFCHWCGRPRAKPVRVGASASPAGNWAHAQDYEKRLWAVQLCLCTRPGAVAWAGAEAPRPARRVASRCWLVMAPGRVSGWSVSPTIRTDENGVSFVRKKRESKRRSRTLTRPSESSSKRARC